MSDLPMAELIALGLVVYIGGKWIAQNYPKEGPQRGGGVRIENNAPPPPVIRTPMNGNGEYGYFRTFFDPTIYHDPDHL